MSQVPKVLIVCGPTAVGKTELALKLVQAFSGDIVACDSRQVYQDMNIGTGKDLPSNAKFKILPLPHYQTSSTNFYGVDVTSPAQAFNSIDYRDYALKTINHIHDGSRLPIFTVGTGLYIKTLFNPPQTAYVPPNPPLRLQLERLSTDNLQQKLQTEDHHKWQTMNQSDRCNPRRLIRAIEVAQNSVPQSSTIIPKYNTLWIGLNAPRPIINHRIKTRVKLRATEKFTQEIKWLIKTYRGIENLPAFSATGYREWYAYFKKVISKEAAIKTWTNREMQYAKRQMTWFNAVPQMNWFDCTQRNWQSHVVTSVKTWYAKK